MRKTITFLLFPLLVSCQYYQDKKTSERQKNIDSVFANVSSDSAQLAHYSMAKKIADSIDKAKQEQIILDLAKNSYDYKQIYGDVHTLIIDIDLAKQGTLNKSDVIDEYNTTIGKYMGYSRNFNHIEKSVKEKGDKLIKMILYKCAAKIAVNNAAEAN